MDAHGGAQLASAIRTWGRDLGFQQVGITGTDLGDTEQRLHDWLAAGHHGAMEYMAHHGSRRTRPTELVPGTRSVIAVRMDYLPGPSSPIAAMTADRTRAAVARYALGRDYHRVLRRRLQHLAERIAAAVGPFGYRVFTDSAPVMEKPLAQRAGLGWIGKHTNLINRHAGSWFFLGELYTDLALPADRPAAGHCGCCRACIEACPTAAIVAPFVLDARRCIAYLTIEHPGSIPAALRPLLGNHVFGCDDCQVVCPWNRFARPTPEPEFAPRNSLDRAALLDLFAWDEATFRVRTAGSAIHRLGHERWLRNLAVALGNAPSSPRLLAALRARRGHPSPLVREHVAWALTRHRGVRSTPPATRPEQ